MTGLLDMDVNICFLNDSENVLFNNITISRPNESLGNPTYTPTTRTIKGILDNHRSVLRSFAISTKDEELNLPSFYRIFKLHIKSLQTGTSQDYPSQYSSYK